MLTRSSFRWFAAEFAVVVTGVLVALALQALYQRGQDHEREAEYIRQLTVELKQTKASMAFSDSLLAPTDMAGVKLLRAYRATASEDSIKSWLAAFTAAGRGRPVIGTAEALVASGDLRLIRNDSLRIAIPIYIARVKNATEVLIDLEREFQAQRGALSGSVDVTSVATEQLKRGQLAVDAARADLNDPRRYGTRFADTAYTPLPRQVTREPFPVDAAALLSDRNAYRAIDRMVWANWSHKGVRRRIVGMADELLHTIGRQ